MEVLPSIRPLYFRFCSQFRLLTCLQGALISGSFILETKGTTNLFNFRTPEQLKIHYRKKHFEALENGVEMQPAKSWGEVKAQI